MADGHVITPGVIDAGTEDVHVVIMLNSGAVGHELEAVDAVLDKPYLQLAADAILVKAYGLHFERARSCLGVKISIAAGVDEPVLVSLSKSPSMKKVTGASDVGESVSS